MIPGGVKTMAYGLGKRALAGKRPLGGKRPFSTRGTFVWGSQADRIRGLQSNPAAGSIGRGLSQIGKGLRARKFAEGRKQLGVFAGLRGKAT
jgi:hypothetical protein